MKRIILLLLLLGLPLAVLADGAVIPATAYPAKVTIPDQRALICWSNGIERLAIETRFTGEGSNFAWVLPLPAPPVIEEASPGLFTTLEYIFRPAIIHNVIPWYLLLLVCAGVVYLLATVRRNTQPRISDTLVSVLVASAITPLSACAGAPLILLLPYVVWRVRTGSESPWLIVVLLFLALLMSSMLLPALGTAGVGVTGSKVSILSHETIGAYETTTIAAKEPQALVEWLGNNGYMVPPAANKIVSNYVNRGWVFVATKLRRDSIEQAISSPQPLCFTFQTDQAVYPMQLTGVGNTNVTVELFVFGPSRAEARFFSVNRCAAPTFPDPENYSRGSTAQLRIAHPLLRKWVAGFPVATKLHANLFPEMMTEDIELQWMSFTEIRHDIYSYQGAATASLNYGVSVFLATLLLAGIVAAFRRDGWKQRFKLLSGLAALAGLITAILFFATVPKTTVRLTRFPAMRSQMNLRSLGNLYLKDAQSNHVTSLAESRAMLKKIQNRMPELTEQNLLLGGPIREEDSPGNYILRQGTNGVGFFLFDANGGEHGLDR